MKARYLGSYEKLNATDGNIFFSHSFAVQSGVASFSTDQPLFSNAVAESVVGHGFEINAVTVPAMEDGIPVHGKNGDQCFRFRFPIGEAPDLTYLGVLPREAAVVRGLPGQAPAEQAHAVITEAELVA